MTKGQYASSPGNRAYCYVEPAVPSRVVADTIVSTHCDYPRRDGYAELAFWVAACWFHTEVIFLPDDGHPSQY